MSPRTVNKYLPRHPRGRPRGDLRWSTFLRLHAQGIVSCDFFVAVTATIHLLYVFVVIEHRSRWLIYTEFAPSPRRTLRRARRSDHRRTPPRVHIGNRATHSMGRIPLFCGPQLPKVGPPFLVSMWREIRRELQIGLLWYCRTHV